MNRERFRTLIDGTLALWQADAQTRFDAAAMRCRILRGAQTLAVLGYELTASGGVWRIEAAGRTTRTHRSVVPVLSSLRDAVCPQCPHGRVLFVPDAADDVTQGS
jgi:hypothetical protein